VLPLAAAAASDDDDDNDEDDDDDGDGCCVQVKLQKIITKMSVTTQQVYQAVYLFITVYYADDY